MNISPILLALDAGNGLKRDAKNVSDALLRPCGAEDGARLFLGQLGLPVCDTTRRTALRCHIPQVVGCRAKEHVVRIDAGPNVAFVADEKTVSDGAVLVFPREAMRSHKARPDVKNAVSAKVLAARPQNATGWVGHRPARQPLANWHVARRAFSVRVAHSLFRPPVAIAGQGRCSRVNAARPAFYTIQSVAHTLAVITHD